MPHMVDNTSVTSSTAKRYCLLLRFGRLRRVQIEKLNSTVKCLEDMVREKTSDYRRPLANHYDTFLAVDGVSAISEARKHEPDLIILDIGLPSGDGFTCWSGCERTRTSL